MVHAIVPSAGKGKRFRSRVRKPYVKLLGEPIVARTLKVLSSLAEVKTITLVVEKGDLQKAKKEIVQAYHLKKVKSIVIGGATRMESVYAGLLSSDPKASLVLVHDAARPLVEKEEIKQLIEAARKYGAVCSGLVPKDTIKQVNRSGLVKETLDRQTLRAVLTPQVFQRVLLEKAYQKAFKTKFIGTDDTSLVEHLGKRVKVLPGSWENIKITTPEDLQLAELILANRLK